MTVRSELAKEELYTQVLRCPKQKESTRVIEHVNTYINHVLNDPNKEIGIIFYKAHIYTGYIETFQEFHIKFHLFTSHYWTQEIHTIVKEKYLMRLLRNVEGMHLISEHLLELTDEMKRKPVYHDNDDDDDDDEDEKRGCMHIPGDTCCQKFINWWLIVPRVQWDFFDLLYQMYTFDITHQGFLPKFIHFFTIPCNVILSMCFLAQFPFIGTVLGWGTKVGYGALEINASMVLLGILALMYIIMGFLRKSWPWGLATALVLSVCWMTGNLWYAVYRTPGNPWYNPTSWWTNPMIWSYIVSLIQASSHMVVPQLPPYITGVSHWESFHIFFCKKYQDTESKCRAICYIVTSLLTFPILSVAVAWFSWPHLIGTEVIYTMAGIGYQPSFFEEYFRVVEKAELSGNPGLDEFPTKPEHLLHDAPAMVEKLQKQGLVSLNPKPAEIVKSVATVKLAQVYFSHNLKRRHQSDLRHMRVVRKGMHMV